MSTFTPPANLYDRITYALVNLRRARAHHQACADKLSKDIRDVAQRRLDDLCERVACRPLHLIDPDMDARLRVDMQ